MGAYFKCGVFHLTSRSHLTQILSVVGIFLNLNFFTRNREYKHIKKGIELANIFICNCFSLSVTRIITDIMNIELTKQVNLSPPLHKP